MLSAIFLRSLCCSRSVLNCTCSTHQCQGDWTERWLHVNLIKLLHQLSRQTQMVVSSQCRSNLLFWWYCSWGSMERPSVCSWSFYFVFMKTLLFELSIRLCIIRCKKNNCSFMCVSNDHVDTKKLQLDLNYTHFFHTLHDVVYWGEKKLWEARLTQLRWHFLHL